MHQHFAALVAIVGLIYWPVAQAETVIYQPPIPQAELPEPPSIFAMTEAIIPDVPDAPKPPEPGPPVPTPGVVVEVPAQLEAQPVYQVPATDPYGYGAYLNEQRSRHNLPPLTYDPSIDPWCAANNQTCVNKGRLGHFTLGPGYVRQNAAWNYDTVASVAQGWWNSIGHRMGILDKTATRYGIAYGPGPYWTWQAN